MKSIFITRLNFFNSKMLLTLKIMNFENVFLTKKIFSFIIIYIIYDQGVGIKHLNLKHSCKLGVKNENFGLIYT
jgi:hypothetical protein